MTYSFICKRCGENFSSVNKKKTVKFKRAHKETSCPLKRTAIGTFARPDLAKHLNKTKYEGSSNLLKWVSGLRTERSAE